MGKDIVFKDFRFGTSCVSALFNNNLTQIRQLCSFVLEEKPQQPSIRSLQDAWQHHLNECIDVYSGLQLDPNQNCRLHPMRASGSL